jgi:hypothetical protein
MNVCMLVEAKHLPVPGNITVVQTFGAESVCQEIGEVTKIHRGNSMFLQGKPQDFIDWFKPFGGVWISNSPATGAWEWAEVRESPLKEEPHEVDEATTPSE